MLCLTFWKIASVHRQVYVTVKVDLHHELNQHKFVLYLVL